MSINHRFIGSTTIHSSVGSQPSLSHARPTAFSAVSNRVVGISHRRQDQLEERTEKVFGKANAITLALFSLNRSLNRHD
jgi:hypothetical protein